MCNIAVAPLVGAWIEISNIIRFFSPFTVAPLVGAWIEITNDKPFTISTLSLLSWERGLKYILISDSICDDKVAPLVGAWIEII